MSVLFKDSSCYTYRGSHFEQSALTVYSSVGIFADNLIWIALCSKLSKNGCPKKSPLGVHGFNIWHML